MTPSRRCYIYNITERTQSLFATFKNNIGTYFLVICVIFITFFRTSRCHSKTILFNELQEFQEPFSGQNNCGYSHLFELKTIKVFMTNIFVKLILKGRYFSFRGV